MDHGIGNCSKRSSDFRHLLLNSLQDILILEQQQQSSLRKCHHDGSATATSPTKRNCCQARCRATCRNRATTEQSRDDVAAWLLRVNHELGLNPETFVLTVDILDRFLIAVKAHPKYLPCIGVSCLFLAMKCAEEDEAIPSTHDFVVLTGGGCSVAEVLRMERVVLDKLDWDLRPVKTSLQVLHILHAIFLLNETTWLSGREAGPRMANRQLASLSRKLFVCLLRRRVVREFRPSTLALALISLELCLLTDHWLAPTIALQRLVGVDETQLIRCREVVSRVLVDDDRRDETMHYCTESHRPTRTRRTATSCNDTWVDDDDDDASDVIRRLYEDIHVQRY